MVTASFAEACALAMFLAGAVTGTVFYAVNVRRTR